MMMRRLRRRSNMIRRRLRRRRELGEHEVEKEVITLLVQVEKEERTW